MKYLKRFATHQQYLDYIANEVNSTHFVGTCDDDHTLEDPFKSHYITSKGKLIEYIYDSYSSTNDLRCYIDTKLVPSDNNWKFIAVFKVNTYNVPGSYGAIFAAYTSENHNTYRILRNGTYTNGDILVHANSKAGGGGKTFYTNIVPHV